MTHENEYNWYMWLIVYVSVILENSDKIAFYI